MEKEFEAVKRLRQETCLATYMPDFDKEECLQVIEKDITEKQNLERFTRLVVEKNLIIAVIEFYAFNRNYEKSIALKVYNSTVNFEEQKLTQEEFDFIKEIIAKYGKSI